MLLRRFFCDAQSQHLSRVKLFSLLLRRNIIGPRLEPLPHSVSLSNSNNMWSRKDQVRPHVVGLVAAVSYSLAWLPLIGHVDQHQISVQPLCLLDRASPGKTPRMKKVMETLDKIHSCYTRQLTPQAFLQANNEPPCIYLRDQCKPCWWFSDYRLQWTPNLEVFWHKILCHKITPKFAFFCPFQPRSIMVTTSYSPLHWEAGYLIINPSPLRTQWDWD